MRNRSIANSQSWATPARINLFSAILFSSAKRKITGNSSRLIQPSKRLCKLLPAVPQPLRRLAHWITFKEDQRLCWQKQYLSQLCEADQEIREAYALIQECTSMLRERKGEDFDTWLEKVEQQGICELRNFALSLKKDYEAVKAGLTLPWSQGPVEGHVHRLKLIKRQAYGRASL